MFNSVTHMNPQEASDWPEHLLLQIIRFFCMILIIALFSGEVEEIQPNLLWEVSFTIFYQHIVYNDVVSLTRMIEVN